MTKRNVPITPGSGDNVRFDDGNQIIKLAYGPDGVENVLEEQPATAAGQSATLAAITAGIGITGAAADYSPQYGETPTGTLPAQIDPGGNLMVRGQVLTDEGGYRYNVANASLAISIGTCTFTNGSAEVSGSGFASTDLHVGNYVYLTADGIAAQQQVESFTDTTITLTSAYGGAGGTGDASRQIVKSVVGAGATITVSSGQATMAAGTTAGSITELERDADYLPLVKETKFSISQRIANQDIYCGFYDEGSPAKWYSWFHFTGTTATTVSCVCAWNPTTAPSGGEIATQTITLPAGLTTAGSLTYRIELLKDRVHFYVNEILVATERRVVPHPHAFQTSTLRIVNGTTPATNTNVVLDYDACNNFNVVSTENPSRSMEITNPSVPATEVLAYNQAGVIAINTDLGFLDASQFRCFTVQVASLGTTGVITIQHSADGGTTWNTVACKPVGVGVSVATITAAGAWFIPGTGGIIRLRLTTATTGGTTTLRVRGMHQVPAVFQDTVLISGTVTVSGTVTANIGTGALAAGTNAIGDVGIQYRANATGAASKYHRVSTADTNAAVVKASAGRLLGWRVANTNAAWRYLKFHNQTTTPTAGTGVVEVIAVPPNSVVVGNMPGGSGFATGIAITAVTGSADADATAVAAGDLIIDLNFA